MNNIVGLDNLPNVYVRRIEIYDGAATQSLSVMIEACIKDVKNNKGNYHWYDDEVIRDNLSIMCVVCHNPALIQFINKGLTVLDPFLIKKHRDYSDGDLEFKTIPVKVKKFKKNNPPGIHSLSYKFRFDISESQNRGDSRSAVYVSSFVDFPKLTNQVGGTVSGEYSTFHGPIQSDIIVLGGRPPENAIAYTTGNGAVYVGPTHSHDKSIMAGAKHTSLPHPVLREKVITNSKTHDYRQLGGAVAQSRRMKRIQANYFSELFTTTDETRSVHGVFYVNIESILLTKTKYGKYLKKFGRDVFNSMVDAMQIKNLTIRRERILPQITSSEYSRKFRARKKLKTEELVTSKDHWQSTGTFNNLGDTLFRKSIEPPLTFLDEKFNKRPLYHRAKLRRRHNRGAPEIYDVPWHSINFQFKKVTLPTVENSQRPPLTPFRNDNNNTSHIDNFDLLGSIKEVPIGGVFTDNKNRPIRCFSFTDSSLSMNDDAYYRYVLDITFGDPTIPYVHYLMDEMQRDLDMVKTYVARYTSHKHYDFEMKRLKQASIVDAQGYFNYEVITARYALLLGFVSLIDDAQAEVIKKRMNGFLRPDSLNRISGNNYIKKYRELYMNFIKLFGVRNSKLRLNKRNRNQKIYQIKNANRINIVNTFEEIINFKNFEYSYDYFDFQKNDWDTVLTMTREEFDKRILDEVNKFGKIELNQDEINELDDIKKSEMLDVIGHRRTYITPKVVHSPKEKIKVFNKKKVNRKKLNNIMATIPRSLRRVRMNNKPPSFMSKVRPMVATGNNNMPFVLRVPLFKTYNFKKAATSTDIDQKDVDFIDAKDYLGDTSPFVTEVSKPKKLTKKQLSILKKNHMLLGLNYSFLRSNKNIPASFFNLKSDENILTNSSDTPSETKDYSKIPLSIKSLLSSRQLVDEIDILRLPDSSTLMDLSHFAIQQINTLLGFKTDNEGLYMLKSPIMTEMNEKVFDDLTGVIMCVMRNYSKPSMGIDIDDDMRLNVHDSIFFIDNPLVNEKITTAGGLQSILQINRYPEYITTNPMNQSPDRDAINYMFKYKTIEDTAMYSTSMSELEESATIGAVGGPRTIGADQSQSRNQVRNRGINMGTTDDRIEDTLVGSAIMTFPGTGGPPPGSGNGNGGGGGMSGGGSSGGY